MTQLVLFEIGLLIAICCLWAVTGVESDFTLEDNSTTTEPPPNHDCLACVPGTYSNGTDGGECTKYCSPGFCSSNYNCTPCTTGYVSEYSNSSKCERCRRGLTNNLDHTNCTECPAGTQGTNIGTCTTCLPGQYNPRTGQIACVFCAPGNYSARFGQSIVKSVPKAHTIRIWVNPPVFRVVQANTTVSWVAKRHKTV